MQTCDQNNRTRTSWLFRNVRPYVDRSAEHCSAWLDSRSNAPRSVHGKRARHKEVFRRVVTTFIGLFLLAASIGRGESSTPIDRQALVTRHNPVIRSVDVDAPLTVGNGGFAFTADITGLQTFADHYHRWGVPTETQSRWCWVTDPNPQKFTLTDASRNFTNAAGKVLAYPTAQSSPAGDWLRKNPRSHPLGQILLDYTKPDGSKLTPEDIQKPDQTLDLWRGIITSQYEIEGNPVKVTTVAHPQQDVVAVRIESELVRDGKLGVKLAFPRGHDINTKNTPALDWSGLELHETKIVTRTNGLVQLARKVATTPYEVFVGWRDQLEFTEAARHEFVLRSGAGNILEFVVGFFGVERPEYRLGEAGLIPRRGAFDGLPSFQQTLVASTVSWGKFWRHSAAVDFSGSTDPRANQIEERIILSRYLMAVQMAGDVPPQESGLTCNTWYGKHHTEMIWWHTAHFALWGNDDLLATNLMWYHKQIPAARRLAADRGLRGARWAKMTGPVMRESPGGNPLIVWNQPHMIHLAELLYRNQPTKETLNCYRELVLQTAECLAAMVHFDEKRKLYVLGPPLWIAQEIYDQAASQNPSFELAYWQWALETAQVWRERLGMKREEKWDHIIQNLTPVPQKDGKYVALESHPDTWDNVASRHDHPTMLGPLGILPGTGVDRATMERTLDAVLETWDWETKIWGWDYPMIAMTAARLGRPETAVEILLRQGPNNVYLPSGHCPQRSDEAMAKNPKPGARKREIAVYLPANGSFLAAVAMMAAGWDGNTNHAPGFPKDGKWQVRVEGVKPLP
jgi:hypothetical protein